MAHLRGRLHALPLDVALVVLAGYGFRESCSWPRGPGGRYTHGGLSLEENVVPVGTSDAADDDS